MMGKPMHKDNSVDQITSMTLQDLDTLYSQQGYEQIFYNDVESFMENLATQFKNEISDSPEDIQNFVVWREQRKMNGKRRQFVSIVLGGIMGFLHGRTTVCITEAKLTFEVLTDEVTKAAARSASKSATKALASAIHIDVIRERVKIAALDAGKAAARKAIESAKLSWSRRAGYYTMYLVAGCVISVVVIKGYTIAWKAYRRRFR